MLEDMKIILVSWIRRRWLLYFVREIWFGSCCRRWRAAIEVITVDDIVDVIHEKHEQDIMRLGGVGEEDDLYSAVIATTRSRFFWLLIHLLAAIVASYVISFFAGTIEEMVTLAVLMPIVATMGGTASVQALTVAVRAIAMKELTVSNALRAVCKEIIVGMQMAFFLPY